jgi:hypothetical protein
MICESPIKHFLEVLLSKFGLGDYELWQFIQYLIELNVIFILGQILGIS